MNLSEATFPCAPMQAGLLYESLSGRAGAYVQQVVITCREHLDEGAIRVAWLRLVERHEALRTSFVIGETAAPVQRIHAYAPPGIVTVDWRGLAEPDRLRQWDELLAAERQTGFEPAHPPLMRVAICRLEDKVTRILWTYHHAILDGRSRLTLLRELFDLYRDATTGRRSSWTPPPSFRRFAEWTAGRGADSGTEAFWRETLRGVEEPTPAPGARRRPDGDTSGSEVIAHRFDVALSHGLRALAQAGDLTVATVLQGAYGMLLAQEADCDDLLFLTTRAGRRSAPFDARDMVGMLMVTSPVRLRLDPEATVSEWLAQVRAFGQAVRDFEHVPLSQALRWSDISRPHPIAETMFSYENASMNTLLRGSDPAWQQRDVQLIEQLDFPLTLEAFGDDEILVKVLYDRSRVRDSEARRILGRYESFVRGCVERQADSVAAVGSLGPSRRRALAGEAVRSPPSELVPDRIREQVARHPGRVAVQMDAREVTYAELGGRAQAIAAQLTDLGAGPGALIAVAMARTPEMVAALLAVHRVGGAYVPVDPSYPADRIRFMVADSGAAVVVSDSSSRDALPALQAELLLADVTAEATVAAAPTQLATPEQLSHVIYTSGSTGTPKGVLVEHRSLAQLTAWAERTFTDAERDGMLASTSLSFDLSVFEILVTLALGGRVVLVKDVLALAEPDFRGRVAFVNSVPSALSALTRTRDLPDTVRTVALAGEALPGGLVERLYAQPSIESVWNLYGPSEDTTYSTAYRCEPGLRPLIGRPLPGTCGWVVDRHLHVVPEGVSGELLLGGAGLARGYLDREDLTADRFVEVRFDDSPAVRAYRTGDRVVWTQDGQLDYLGRLDDQVKIRGVRVEPGELEHAIRALDGVRDAAVIVRGEAGDRGLAAYVVGPGLEPGTLRDALTQRLPSALVPDLIAILDSLPVTANGKLDRRALPELGHEPPSGAGGTIVGPTQQALAALWTEVLGLQSAPGPEDDFFALGGDSLRALYLLTCIEERFGRRLSVRTLLACTRLVEQADAIDATYRERATGTLIPLRATGTETPFMCVLTDHRGVMGLRNVLPATLVNQPVFAVQAIDPAVPSWRSSTIEQIAGACLLAVRAQQPRGPYRLGGHSLGGVVAFEMARILQRDGERVELLVLLDTVAPHGFRWPGRLAARHRLLRGTSVRRHLRGYASVVQTAAKQMVALARGEVVIRSWPRGFDDPWDRAGASRVVRRYHPKRLAAPVMVMSTDHTALLLGARDLGWGRHVKGPVLTRRLPGVHEMIFNEPDVLALAQALGDAFAALDAGPPRS